MDTTTKAPSQPAWWKDYDSREHAQVIHAQAYAQNHIDAGAPGHGQFLLIAKMARSLDQSIAQKDGAYAERDKCLVLVALMAQRLGLKVGIGLHVDKPGEDWDADWRSILFIDLPAGQVSWHIHDSETSMFYFVGAYDGEWDGHTTDEKYQRVLEPGL